MTKLLFTSLGLAALLSLPTAYAGDCTTSFDQSCLATRYNRSQVERDLETKEARANAELKAQEDQAEHEEREARRHLSQARAERRYTADVYDAQEARAERAQRYRERIEAIDKRYEAATDTGFFKRSTRPSRYRR